jgi:hypothetical protein
MKTQRSKYPLRTSQVTIALAAVCATFGFAQADSPAQLASSMSSAAAHSGASASLSVEQRVRSEMRAVVVALIESGAFGDKPPQQIALDVDAPAQRVGNLGVVVDSARAADDGLHVLGVTPGSGAERTGLRAGDVLVAMNGISLAGNSAMAAANLRRTVDALPDGSTLAFQISRDGHTQSVSGPLASVYVPAMRLHIGDGVQVASNAGGAGGAGGAAATAPDPASDCGRISDFDVAPRQQQLHAAKIIAIDGVTPGPTGAKSYRVAAGSHVVTVFNRIESQYLPFNDMQRNSGLTDSHYKKLTIDVAPDTTTLIAARLNTDNRNDWQRDAYWDPVAWKQVAEACR